MEAVKNYSRRSKAHAIFNVWIIVQYVLLFWKFTIVLLGMTATSSAGLTNWRIALGAIGLISYLGLVTYFVFIRGCRDKFILGLVSMPVALVSLVFLTFPLGNFTAALYYSHVENELSKELGYPSFPRLNVTTFNTDADNLSELTYDSTLPYLTAAARINRESLSEELRLLYVALTRAKEYLILPIRFGGKTRCPPSSDTFSVPHCRAASLPG